ncbi:MAG: hypothetical protein CVV49_00130 [Spirochaetae bacterium HGW-Spirochaetae-5]|nr:MAG: hypothetical protein CVV49_00130 [Spirochaetae bacterium HGW-Spirochaetae-5]
MSVKNDFLSTQKNMMESFGLLKMNPGAAEAIKKEAEALHKLSRVLLKKIKSNIDSKDIKSMEFDFMQAGSDV